MNDDARLAPTTLSGWFRAISGHAGGVALGCFGLTGWILVALARFQHFEQWPIVLPFCVATVIAGLIWWWQQPWLERATCAGLFLLGLMLYSPPAEHLPLAGDAAIYPNEGAYIAANGGLSGEYAPFTVLSPATRDLFFISWQEQFPHLPLPQYEGMLYRGYYLVDPNTTILHTSRMPMTEVWFAFLISLTTVGVALWLTPVMGALAIVALYQVGRELYDLPVALWATALIAISYPQVHFARAAYAEIPGQFWTLCGMLLALRWIRLREPWLLAAALLCWATAWSARIDALFLLGPVVLLIGLATLRRSSSALRAAGFGLALAALLLPLAYNAPYVNASFSLFLPRFGQLAMIAAVGALTSVTLVSILWRGREKVLGPLLRVTTWLMWVGFALSAFVVIWSTIPNPWRQADDFRRFQQIMWYSSSYVTPLFFWLALAGVGTVFYDWVFLRRRQAALLFLVATTLGLSLIYFDRYTTARVYPVSLRRLISDALPLLALVGGAFLAKLLAQRDWRRWLAIGVAAVSLGWMAVAAWPAIHEREAQGNVKFLQELHDGLAANGVYLFEQQDDDSWVGWLAAPLYSLYGDWALIFDSDAPDPSVLVQAVSEFEHAGRPVYLVSQQQPAPAGLVPTGFTASPVTETNWRSSLLGQIQTPPYPPPYWVFDFPLNIYRLERDAQ